jgi:archaellum component FlaC
MKEGIEAAIETLGNRIGDLESTVSWKQSQIDGYEKALKEKDEEIERLKKKTAVDLCEEIARGPYKVMPMEKKAGPKP